MMIFSVWCMSACNDTDKINTSFPQETSAFCFSVQNLPTRLGYNFEETTFDDKEWIGCVIAEKKEDGTYTYLRNSAWQYRADDGMLIFQYYWGYTAGDNDWSNKVWSKIYSETSEYTGEDSNSTLISDKILIKEKERGEDYETADDSFLYSPYLKANSDKKLQFFFYYPYVDSELLKSDYKKIIENTETDKYKLLAYPNYKDGDTNIPSTVDDNGWNSITLIGEIAANETTAWGQPTKYGWREYPCFVNHTQGDINAEGRLNDIRLQNSDFLWTASEEIDATTERTIRLQFQKKTATLLVYSEAPLNEIYFQASKEKTLIRGNQIDLVTGILNVYDDPNQYYETSLQKKAKYFKSGEHIIPYYRGYDVAEGSYYYFYRLVLPAQTNCNFKMHIKIENSEVDTDINLSDDNNLTELKEGYLYSIRISKDGRTDIRINDWKEEAEEELEEVTDAQS